MAQFISLKKICTEENSMERSVTAANPVITACAKIYINAQMVEELQEQITGFLAESDLEGYWENDVPGIGGPPCVTMRFLPEEAPENALIEIYMELNDGGSFMEHNCRFFVPTTRMQLKAFAEELPRLNSGNPGTEVTLNR